MASRSEASPIAIDAFVETVERWWAGARAERDLLPWRATQDPWCVLVSETMLAQTQVGRVAPQYRAFVERFPTVQACAESPLGDVVKHWVGLGYNRRAVMLHNTARAIVAKHGGIVPNNLDDLLALPGVGRYTARAVLAFAFNVVVGVVDTNIGRVLARAVAGRTLSVYEAQAYADSVVPRGKAREWNLAVMDFGSLVCQSRVPLCSSCGVGQMGHCAWRSQHAAADPARGSAGVSKRQGVFAGSDRQGRGRLVRAACGGPIRSCDIASVAGWPNDPLRAERVASALVAEGVLARDDAGALRLS